MSERIPLSKSELKKMFLRVLYECLYGSMKSHSHGIDSIVPHWMNEYFKIKMTPQEIQLTHEAIQELKNSGIIFFSPTKFLTQLGVRSVEKSWNFRDYFFTACRACFTMHV